ncbi:hypothetical protein N8334_00230 [Flavobacteriaceae bacterium]|nr:hypothetical protein [Flavobacteriaceae bacterium]|tara:strand:- start:1190 stop:1744 length:555 start_codon:yes stop_codon:yes gene_type:complete
MEIIHHQFIGESFFLPNWTIKYLFLGTFNPNEGEKVNYFYSRKTNLFWTTLSKIFQDELNPNNSDFLIKLKTHKIACMDLINSVEISNTDKEFIIGKGYSDSRIINNSVKRTYNTENINSVIKKNPNVQLYSTWGKGSNLTSWKKELNKLPTITKLVSPSRVARVPKGENKENFVLNNWKKNIL